MTLPHVRVPSAALLCLTLVACGGNRKNEPIPIYSKPGNDYEAIDQSLEDQVTTGQDTDQRTGPIALERRWVGGLSDSPQAHLSGILSAFNVEKGTNFKLTDFWLSEERLLATSKYRRYVQMHEGIPVGGKSIRIWTHPETNQMIQIEAALAHYPQMEAAPALRSIAASDALTQKQRIKEAIKLAQKHALDPAIKEIVTEVHWDGEHRMQSIAIHAELGKHLIKYDDQSGQLISNDYKAYPQGEQYHRVPARVYPVWEFPYGESKSKSQLIPVDLDYLYKKLPQGGADTFASIGEYNLVYSNYDSLEGNTPSGRQKGLWNQEFVGGVVRGILDTLPYESNVFGTNDESQVFLHGKYASVYIHPRAGELEEVDFTPQYSADFYFDYNFWSPGDVALGAKSRLYGLPLTSRLSAYDRDSLQEDGESSNDIATLVNSGFDEIQMYWAINVLFEELHDLGFSDPELAFRPFKAILYNPSINARDNAFYTNDTINFTNYTPGTLNLARDNTTIWHELGHGLQDRMMGDHYRFTDSGGLNEGMADIIAHLVLMARTHGKPFLGEERMRINNQIGFHLTNESHDDGEAYGGAMRDIMRGAMANFGFFDGLARASELIFETMRLTRDHPGINAEVWFEHMVFADSLERDYVLPSGEIRQGGEMRDIIIEALRSRNYKFSSDSEPAQLDIQWDGNALNSYEEGSRYTPVKLSIDPQDAQSFTLDFKVKDGTEYQFKFPVRIEIHYENGPLQGAVNWRGQNRPHVSLVFETAETVHSHEVTANGTCDYINRSDGTCSDFVYIKLFEQGVDQPIAKKRFYVHVNGIEE